MPAMPFRSMPMRILLPVTIVLLTGGIANAQEQEQPGRGFHLQAGLGMTQAFAGESIPVQLHPRLSLRYDRSTDRAWRVTGRHQRLSLNNDAGHSELTVTPTILQRWRIAESFYAMAGVGISLGAFSRFVPEGVEPRPEQEYGIPIAGEASATLNWKFHTSLSLELTADYRPVFFSDGALEHVMTQSVSLSLDL